MPALFQAVSRLVLYPERVWPSSREQEAFLRLSTDKSRTPQRKTRLLGGVEPGVGSQELPKELRFQELTNSRTLPRVSVKYLPGWTGAHPIKLEHYYFVPSNSIKVRGSIPKDKVKLSVNRERVRGKNKAEIDRKTPIKKIQIPQRTSANPDKKLHPRKLPEKRPSLADLGDIEGPRNPKGLTSKMKPDFDLPNNWKKWQEPKSAPRYIRDSIYLANRTFRQEQERQKDKKKPNTHSSGSAFKLGKQLKIHDYGFKKIKQRKSKDSGRRDSNDSPLSNVSDACSQRTFRSLSLSERSFARQTALDMFVKISKSYEERLASELEQPQEPEDIDLTGESVSSVIPGSSEKSISGESKTQSIENESCEIHTTFNFPQISVPSDGKERQPSEILKEKISTSIRRRSPVPQTDAETQTICACGICQFLNKSKAEKLPPLVVEMANNRKMLEQRNYYMENLRQATMKFNDGAEKSPHSALPFSKSMKSDYSKHRNHCIYEANRKDKVSCLRGPKNISECYRDPIAVRPCETINHKTHRFADYRAPNVANIFARCYHTLFEAEQRTNGILPNDCQENVCCV